MDDAPWGWSSRGGDGRSLRSDRRASVPGDQLTLFNSPLLVLILAVLLVPPLVAMIGVVVNRKQSFQYMFAAGASLVAVFTLTGTVQFAPLWTVLGVLAILAAITSHLWQFREDSVDFLVVSGIYAMPVGLAGVLLLREVGGF
jgi:hypothetical protein